VALLVIGVYNLDERFAEDIRRAAGDGLEVLHARSMEDIEGSIGETEVMYGFRVRGDLLEKAVTLRWIQATGAGVDWALTPEFVASPIVLTNVSGIHAVQMSEHVLGMMLALVRGFTFYIPAQGEKRWDRSLGLLEGSELYEKTLGVLGLGAIGEALAARAKAFGMHVIGVKRSPLGYHGAADEVVGPGALERVFSEADFIVDLLPLTSETRGMVSGELIGRMKRRAYFFNLGRGATVDEAALTHALTEGKIAGAGLDVFVEEPLPEASALWGLPNVIITPHTSGHSPHYWERATAIFCENLRRYRAGGELLNVVDKELGY
jgi:phosphoglycerate dehydrogenase-like enzyme